MSYWTGDAGWRSSSKSQHDRLGPTGRYVESFNYTDGDVHFTGDKYGFGPFIINGLGDQPITASFSGGGTLPMGNLTTGQLYDFSIIRISGSVLGEASASITFFKKG